MPVAAAGQGTARLKDIASPQIGQQDPSVPAKSRRQPTPPGSPLARSARSNRPRNAQQPACRRQIPIDRADPTTEPKPPRFPPLRLVRRLPIHAERRYYLATAGVRQPLTTTVIRGLEIASKSRTSVPLDGSRPLHQRRTKPHIIASFALFSRTLWSVRGEEHVLAHTGTAGARRPPAHTPANEPAPLIQHAPLRTKAIEIASLSYVTNGTRFGPSTTRLKLISDCRGGHEVTQTSPAGFRLRWSALPGGAPR